MVVDDPQVQVVDAPSAEEAAEAARAAAASAAKAKPGEVKLFDPGHESLTFGENNEIAFGPRGGFEPNVWVGPEDHPLLESLLKLYPAIQIVRDQNTVYVCGTCEEQFATYTGWKAHQRKHKGAVVRS